jgi:hypothetical protein
MNDSSGYIRSWNRFKKIGTVFGCSGAATGENVGFLYEDVNDFSLQKELASRGDFNLDRNCDPLAAGASPVNFLYETSQGLALNIVRG